MLSLSLPEREWSSLAVTCASLVASGLLKESRLLGRFGRGKKALAKLSATGSSAVGGTMLFGYGVPLGFAALTVLAGATEIRLPRMKLCEKSPVRSAALGTRIFEVVAPRIWRVTAVLTKKKVWSLPL